MLRTTAGRPRRVFKVWPSGLSKGIACSAVSGFYNIAYLCCDI